MSNIDNHFNDINKSNPNPPVEKESYTEKVQKFLEDFDNIIPFIVEEYDDLEKRSKTKTYRAFSEKMNGLAAIKQFHDNNPDFKDALYWYVTQPKEPKYSN